MPVARERGRVASDGRGAERRSTDLISTSVVEAIASANQVRPTEADFQLYDYLDLEALDRLYRHTRTRGGTNWQLEFTVDGFDVVVSDDGDVTVA